MNTTIFYKIIIYYLHYFFLLKYSNILVYSCDLNVNIQKNKHENIKQMTPLKINCKILLPNLTYPQTFAQTHALKIMTNKYFNNLNAYSFAEIS